MGSAGDGQLPTGVDRAHALPPGQRALAGFPRFGAHLDRPPPAVPTAPTITVRGEVDAEVEVPVEDLRTWERADVVADFHCVAGWSSTGVRWSGVPFSTFYSRVVAPAVRSGAAVTHLSFRGLDGYRSVVLLEDVLAPDVLLADELGGRPLDGDHGAPVRLVSPRQYGFVSTKHLCEIAVHTGEPRVRYHPSLLVELGLRLVKPHPRARVAHEERHRYLPARVVRPAYRHLVAPIRLLSARRRRAVRATSAGG